MYKHNNLFLTTLLVFMVSFGHADVYINPLGGLEYTDDIDNIVKIIELDEAMMDDYRLNSFMNSTEEELNSKPSKDDIIFMLESNRIKSEASLNSTLVGELLPQIKELVRQSTAHLKSKLSGMTNGIKSQIASLESALHDEEDLFSNTSQDALGAVMEATLLESDMAVNTVVTNQLVMDIGDILNKFTSETEMKLTEMTSEIRGISDRMTHTETVLKSLEEGIASKPSLRDIEELITKYHHLNNNSPAINHDSNTEAVKMLYCNNQGFQQLFEDSCYLFSYEGAFWQNAQDNCLQMGGNLVKISSSGEFHFLKDQIHEDTWIGLNDIEIEGQFRWTDGSQLTAPQSWWANHEPNNQEGNQNCVNFWFNGDGDHKWNDFDCNGKEMKYICEMPALAL